MNKETTIYVKIAYTASNASAETTLVAVLSNRDVEMMVACRPGYVRSTVVCVAESVVHGQLRGRRTVSDSISKPDRFSSLSVGVSKMFWNDPIVIIDLHYLQDAQIIVRFVTG